MRKKELRTDYKNRRKSITESMLRKSSQAMADAALALPIWDYAYFHLYLPIAHQKEVETRFILNLLRERNKNVVLPKLSGPGSFKNYLYTDATELRTNSWNIPEPVDGIAVPARKIDVVFLPLLVFDNRGNRVGYGKGFYDNFLRECRRDVTKIGLSLFDAVDAIEDIHENDVPLDYCITPGKTYSFLS